MNSGSYTRFKASVGFGQYREGRGQDQGNAAGAGLLLLGDALSEELGKPLGILDYSMVYLKCNFRLRELLNHRLSQIVRKNW